MIDFAANCAPHIREEKIIVEVPVELAEEFEDVVGILVSRLFHTRNENPELLEMAMEVQLQVKEQRNVSPGGDNA